MKKILLPLLIFSNVLIAQNRVSYHKEIKDNLNKKIVNNLRSASQSQLDCSNPNYLYCEDFESASSPALPSDLTTMSQETGYNVNVNSTNQVVSGFYTGNSQDANVGGYWPVEEHTQFAMTNDDACKPNGATPNENNNCDLSLEVLQLPMLDFTGQTNVFLLFDYYHDKNYGGGDAYVEYKIGSAGSWINLSGNLDIGEVWQEGIFSLSALNNTDSVTIRFVWSDNNSWASGFAIDNIAVGELNDNELSLQTVNQYLPGASYASTYSKIPLSQLGNGVYFRGIIRNIGNNQQDSTRLKVEVASEQYSTESWGKNLTSLERDTFLGNYFFNPQNAGNYQISYTAESDSTVTDAKTLEFEVTDFTFARDNGNPDLSFSLISAVGDAVTIEHGNSFDINENITLYAVDVYISDRSDTGGKIKAKVYSIDNGTANYLYESDYFSINSVGAWQSVKFEVPVNLDAGIEYLVTVGGNGLITSDTTRIGGSSAIDGSYGWRIYNGYSSGSNTYQDGIYASIPMVRMNFDPNVPGPIGVQEEKILDFSIYPNPNNGEFNVFVPRKDDSKLSSIEVKNLIGQLVYSQTNINNSTKLNLSHLSKGLYTVNVIASNNTQSSQKIIIQ